MHENKFNIYFVKGENIEHWAYFIPIWLLLRRVGGGRKSACRRLGNMCQNNDMRRINFVL